jgi:hypothetical protein
MKRVQLIHRFIVRVPARLDLLQFCGKALARFQFRVPQGELHESVHRMLRVAELECCRFFQQVDNKNTAYLILARQFHTAGMGKRARSSHTASYGPK